MVLRYFLMGNLQRHKLTVHAAVNDPFVTGWKRSPVAQRVQGMRSILEPHDAQVDAVKGEDHNGTAAATLHALAKPRTVPQDGPGAVEMQALREAVAALDRRVGELAKKPETQGKAARSATDLLLKKIQEGTKDFQLGHGNTSTLWNAIMVPAKAIAGFERRGAY